MALGEKKGRPRTGSAPRDNSARAPEPGLEGWAAAEAQARIASAASAATSVLREARAGARASRPQGETSPHFFTSRGVYREADTDSIRGFRLLPLNLRKA